VSNHTPSPPPSFSELYPDISLIDTPEIGQFYKNKHNGRVVKVVEHYVSDRGSIFYGIRSVDNDKDVIDYNTVGTMNTHWDLVESDEE
jgi:hypothetical protein